MYKTESVTYQSYPARQTISPRILSSNALKLACSNSSARLFVLKATVVNAFRLLPSALARLINS